jgi:hypothetical protein
MAFLFNIHLNGNFLLQKRPFTQSFMDKILKVFLIMMISTPSVSQVSWGIKGGGNVCWIQANENPRLGYHGGVFSNVPVKNNFSMALELLLSDKGYSMGRAKEHFLYLTLPVAGRISVKKFSFDAGFSPGLLLSNYLTPKIEDSSERDWYTLMNIDLIAGINYTLSPAVGLSVRYEYGMNNVISKSAQYQYYSYNNGTDPLLITGNFRDLGYDERHRNFQLSISYTFIRKK